MISLKEWAGIFSSARTRLPTELRQAVVANAELAKGIAKASIGNLQPERAVGPPVPSVFPAWPALADKTIGDKTRLGFGPPDWEPLYRTGQGQASIEAVAVGLTGGVVSNDKVMFYHEVGTSLMPPRPVFAPAVALTMPMFEKMLGALAVNVLMPVRK